MSRILITSALPYINGAKHLGNLAGSMLPADVYARFKRSQGHETLYICATDEHGTPAELAAAAAGQDVATYCQENHALQRDIGERFGLSWDWFGRSSSPQNAQLTQHFADVLEDNGYIEERLDKMVFSVDDDRFLPDRYIEGVCPRCAYPSARGDQCDNCGNLLDPVDLIEPYSVISGSRNLEIRETRHLYLRQTKLAEPIRQWLNSKPEFSGLARSIGLKHLDEGLIDRGITRDLAWGVPVTRGGQPRTGFEGKVFYVWFDAPVEYIGATKEWADANGQGWERWWREDKGASDVRYVEFMGKDNVAFHTISFPATILGSGEPWKTVDVLKAFNWLNWYGDKFSTSQKRGVFMDVALEIAPALREFRIDFGKVALTKTKTGEGEIHDPEIHHGVREGAGGAHPRSRGTGERVAPEGRRRRGAGLSCQAGQQGIGVRPGLSGQADWPADQDAARGHAMPQRVPHHLSPSQ